MFSISERLDLLAAAAFSCEDTSVEYTQGVLDVTARVLDLNVEELANVLGIDLFPAESYNQRAVEDTPLPEPGTINLSLDAETGRVTSIKVDDKAEQVVADGEEFTPVVHLRGIDKSKSACGRVGADAVLVDGDKVDTVTCKRCPNTLLYDKAMTAWMRKQEVEAAQSA